MVWKRFDDISQDDPLAAAPLAAVGFWSYLLGIADTRGRFPADPARLKSVLNKRSDLRLPQIADCLSTLAHVGAIHLYRDPAATGDGQPWDSVGRQFGVIHEYARHVPPGALRYNSPTYPEPPAGICRCLFVPSPSSPSPKCEAPPAAARPRRPSPSPSSGKEGMQGEKGETQRGVYGRSPDQRSRRAPPRPDCPKCRGSGYYQSSIAVGNASAAVTVSCECREEPK